MKHAISTYLIACVLSLLVAQAAVPGQINYQGRLTDSNGDPVTGSKTLDVAIYDAARGGNLLYRETIGAVTLDASGIYSFQFGSEGDGVAAAIAGAPEHWLEISVDGVKQATRDRVLAVPFALNAARAESSDDGVSGVTFDVDGNLIVTLKDGSQINAGQVREAPFALNAARAESSDDGVSGVTFDVDGNLIVTLKDGSQINAGQVREAPFALNAARAESSDDGVSGVTFDVDGNLIVTLKDGSQINAGQVREARDWQRQMLYGGDDEEGLFFGYGEGTSDFSADGKILVDVDPWGVWVDTYLIDGEQIYSIDESVLGLGWDIDLSADGKTVAGGGRAFRWVDGQWVQLGADVELVAEENIYVTSISADGNTMAVGIGEEYDVVSDSYPSYIRVYRFDGLSWQQLGGDIRDEFRNYDSPSISADGNTLAVTVTEYDEVNDSEAWYIRAYRFDGLSWQQLGGDIRNDSYGYFSLFISDNGQTLAFSADNFELDPDTGDLLLPYISEARVYRYNGSNWQKLGADFNDDANHIITSISGDGNTVAVKLLPDPYEEGMEDARIYRYNGLSWQQLGRDILFGLRDYRKSEEYGTYDIGPTYISTLKLTADGNAVLLSGLYNWEPKFRIYRLSP